MRARVKLLFYFIFFFGLFCGALVRAPSNNPVSKKVQYYSRYFTSLEYKYILLYFHCKFNLVDDVLTLCPNSPGSPGRPCTPGGP